MADDEASEGIARLHRDLFEELQQEAATRGLSWSAVVERAGLSKTSRARLNDGTAGLPTIAKVRSSLDELTAKTVQDGNRPATRGAAPPLRRRRWVLVHSRDGQIFFGATADPDETIAETERVRIDSCRLVSGNDLAAAAMAALGPGSATVGPEVPSALIVGISVVYDCSRKAADAFRA